MLKKLIPPVFHCPYRHRGFPVGLLLGVDSSTAEPLAVRRSRGATGQLQGSQINGSYSTNLELFQYPSFCPNWRSSWVWAFPLTLPTVGTQPVLATPHSEVLLTHHTNTLSIFQSDCAPSWVLFALPRMPSLPTLPGKHIFSIMSQLFIYNHRCGLRVLGLCHYDRKFYLSWQLLVRIPLPMDCETFSAGTVFILSSSRTHTW